MISVSWEPPGILVRVSAGDRLLTWPGLAETVIPIGVISGATSHPSLATLPDRTRVFSSTGRGVRTRPNVPGRWAFGRRRINNETFLFALRGRDTPVLVLSLRNWQLDGAVVSTPEAARLAAKLSALGYGHEVPGPQDRFPAMSGVGPGSSSGRRRQPGDEAR